MTIPDRETQYAKTDDGYIGFQVFGSGPRHLLVIQNWMTNLEMMWQEPALSRYFERLGSFARVIVCDNRGAGVSDPISVSNIPSLDRWMDDLLGVLDAAGADRVDVMGETEGGPVAMMFTATHPERVRSLTLVNSFARWRRDDDYPAGMPDDTLEHMLDLYEEQWGQQADMLALTAPSRIGDERFRRWFMMYQRLAIAPGQSAAIYRWVLELDVRHVLPSVQVPTLVIHRSGNMHHRVGHGRYLAEHIPGATYLEVEGADSYPIQAGDTTEILDAIEEFITGEQRTDASDRMLATIMFTDIVGSTDRAASLGDQQWLDDLAVHDRVTHDYIDRYRGTIRDTTGDGVLATFDGPARAVNCALKLEAELARLGIPIRVGVHTGEIELRDDKVGGIGVHIASRVVGHAPDNGVAASSTVRDLVVGSTVHFSPIGAFKLKGVPGEWELFEVSEPS